jgi:hypothetical protein
VKSFPVVPTSVTHGKFRRVIKINFLSLRSAECRRGEVLQLKKEGVIIYCLVRPDYLRMLENGLFFYYNVK